MKMAQLEKQWWPLVKWGQGWCHLFWVGFSTRGVPGGDGLVSSKPWRYGAVRAFDSVGDLEDERRHPVPARDSPSLFTQWKWV